jgi:mRNA interferase MazF
VKRGEIRWYTFRLPDKRRPVLVLTRNDVIDRLNEIIVVPATRTIRGLTTEIVLKGVGLVRSCATYQKRDGLKRGMRCSSRAVSEDQAIEAARQAWRKNDRSEVPRARFDGRTLGRSSLFLGSA